VTAATGRDGVGRLRARGAVLVLGAVSTSVLIAPVGGLSLYWMPLFVGVSYLAASAVGGRTGGLWVPGLMVSFWGLADVLVLSGTLHVNFASAAITGVGLGALAAVLVLPRVQVPVTVLSLAVNTLLIGLLELAEAQVAGVLVDGWAWGLLLLAGGGVGVAAVGDDAGPGARRRLSSTSAGTGAVVAVAGACCQVRMDVPSGHGADRSWPTRRADSQPRLATVNGTA
jgi:hypothetical protein